MMLISTKGFPFYFQVRRERFWMVSQTVFVYIYFIIIIHLFVGLFIFWKYFSTVASRSQFCTAQSDSHFILFQPISNFQRHSNISRPNLEHSRKEYRIEIEIKTTNERVHQITNILILILILSNNLFFFSVYFSSLCAYYYLH